MPISLLINRLNIFSNLSASLESYLRSHVKKEKFGKNSIVYEQGAHPKKIYFILKGLVAGTSYSEDRQYICWFKKEGDFFWDIHGFLDFTQPSKQTASTFEATSLLSLSYQAVFQMFEIFPESNYIWRKLLQQKMADDYKRTELLFILHTATRYQKFLEVHRDDYQRLKNGQIASYLQMDPATLSRIKSKLFP